MNGVSDDLRMIADWIAVCAIRDRPIQPQTAAQLAKVLLNLSIQAEAQELLPILLAVCEERCVD